MKTIINANQMGLLYENGALTKILPAGKYYTYGSKRIETLSVEEEIKPAGCTLEQLLALPDADKYILSETVGAEEAAILFAGGQAMEWLEKGRHAFWKNGGHFEVHKYSTTDPEMTEDAVRDVTSAMFLRKIGNFISADIADYQVGRMYINGQFQKLLGAGRYLYWFTLFKRVSIDVVDMREQKLDIPGQEILTADKVALRINFTVFYKITDAKKIAEVTKDINDYLYVKSQLVLREYISKYKMDEILENRERISDEVITQLRSRTADAFVEITTAGIKDIILPGEISAIMNSVLAAEKRAQANVITRREEVASTRSLLNTAKLMDENATLRKLKELEYLERICENVGGITVDGSHDLLSQLAAVVTGSQS